VILCDVNIFVYAFREDTPLHSRAKEWLEEQLHGERPYGYSDLVLSSFLRIVTNPRIFKLPAPVDTALDFTQTIRLQPQAVSISPGEHHWSIFSDLCGHGKLSGNLIPDAFLAAIALESGCEWITTDRDYARFPGLNRRNPL